ncbi:MAG: cyclophane-forming radical SAM/SPASM peptide maturase GrrM/OscB [Crocosphaera sp.]|nr:cyclophane-forming radical SAM/SPASM peptide maturase GrrM/OscB [Crocosphaera sp.]
MLTRLLEKLQITPESPQLGTINLVVIQPTTFCNLDCDYCYLPDKEAKLQLSADLIEPIFKNIFTSNLLDQGFTVVWHAGEPLTVPISFYELVFKKIDKLNNSINKNPYKILHSIQTNATLINQAWCDLINQYQVKIGVSIDGPAFIHDAHRKTRKGTGTHASTMRGISFLQKNNIEFSIIAVLTADSLDYPNEIFNFFLENKMRYIGFNIDEIEGTNSSSSFSQSGIEKRYINFMKRLYKLVKETNGYMKVREFDQTREFIAGNRDISQGQFTPFTMINISHQGDFSTFSPELLSMKSETYGDFIIGNLLKDTIESASQTEKFKRMSQDIYAGVKQCEKTCSYYSVCGGGAPANKYYENGSFRTAETLYCKYTTKILTDIVLEEMEKELGLC